VADPTQNGPDEPTLPASLKKAMKNVRNTYQADVSEDGVQQTLDRIVAQTTGAPDERKVLAFPKSRRPLWFAAGLSTGLAAAIALFLFPATSSLFARHPPVQVSDNLADGPLYRVAVPDAGRAARTCIAELLESGVPFTYRLTPGGPTLHFRGSKHLSAGMTKWLNDHGLEAPADGESIVLLFVQAA
jgi:hypothetical protein